MEGLQIVNNGIENQILKIEELSNFFYSLVINYSHYALNSAEIGSWITNLFHKNDGYQTPIVLNPMRTLGIIDINTERYLLGRRLQANILEEVEEGNEKNSLRNITNGKIAKELKLLFAPSRVNKNLKEPKNLQILKEIINGLNTYFDCKINLKELDDNIYLEISLNYIFEKLIKISKNYKPFSKFKARNTIKDVDRYIQDIRSSNSHITFKLKGVILYIKYYHEIFGDHAINYDHFNISVQKLARSIAHIKEIEKKFFEVNTFMMAPPSFFQVEIIPEDGSQFDSLSSGEKQRIHSISSIVYHLMNLNSVEQQKLDKGGQFISYNFINLILDEIELYYHPDWQRKYINDLLDYIGKINPDNLKHIKGLNVTFLTHSPYILSDVPISNILRLVDGSPQNPNPLEQTFGANIHELLAKDFFMNDGFMGEFAKQKIETVIFELNYLYILKEYRLTKIGFDEKYKEKLEKELRYYESKINKNQLNSRKRKIENIMSEIVIDKDKMKKIIDIVGEPLIKSKLESMYNDIFHSDSLERKKIELEKMAIELGVTIIYPAN